jgi:hydrogenase expression/formation protein HypC
MCLAIPGLVLSRGDDCPGGASHRLELVGHVRFGDVTRQVNLAYVPEVRVGDYVIVHSGFAIGKLSEAEAARVFAALRDAEASQTE